MVCQQLQVPTLRKMVIIKPFIDVLLRTSHQTQTWLITVQVVQSCNLVLEIIGLDLQLKFNSEMHLSLKIEEGVGKKIYFWYLKWNYVCLAQSDNQMGKYPGLMLFIYFMKMDRLSWGTLR